MGAARDSARSNNGGHRARTAIGWASGGAAPETGAAPAATASSETTGPGVEAPRDGYETGSRLGISPGEVYEATHARLPGRFAIKFLTRAKGATGAAVEDFQFEAEQISILRHPNIVEVIELGVMPDGTPILVMEHLEGRTLDELLSRRGPMALGEVLPIVRGVATALEAAHGVGVVHREVRPDNVFIANVTGYEQGFVKLLDFGVSRLNAGPSPGSNLATAAVHYLSPEQARGLTAEVDARTDQYALAAMAYRMLAGTDAHVGNDAVSILYRILNEAPRPLTTLARVDTGVDAVIRKAMSRDKRLRFDSVFVFAKALEDAASGNSRAFGTPTPPASRAVTPAPVSAPERAAPAPERAAAAPERAATPVQELAAAHSEPRSVQKGVPSWSDFRAMVLSSDRTPEPAVDPDAPRDEQDDDKEPAEWEARPEPRSRKEERELRRLSGHSEHDLPVSRAPARAEVRSPALSAQVTTRAELPSQRTPAPSMSPDRSSSDQLASSVSSDRLSSRSSDRHPRRGDKPSFRDTLSERFFADGDRKGEEGSWTAADLDDQRPEGADQFDDFDAIPRRRWPMYIGLAMVAALVPVVVTIWPDIQETFFSSRPSSFWSDTTRTGETILPTTVPGAPAQAAAIPLAVDTPTAAETAAARLPPGAAATNPTSPPSNTRTPAGTTPAAPIPPTRPAAGLPAPHSAATSPAGSAPSTAAAPSTGIDTATPTGAAAPSTGIGTATPTGAAAPITSGWGLPSTPPPAVAPELPPPAQPSAAQPTPTWLPSSPTPAPPTGGWANQPAPTQPIPAAPTQPSASAAWGSPAPQQPAAAPAPRERTGDVPLRGYVWSPKERRLVPAQ